MTQKDRDHYLLSNGREFYANTGLISIGPDDQYNAGVHGFRIMEGYDGGIDTDKWTPAEQVELAEFMIAQWQAFAAAARAECELNLPQSEAISTDADHSV